MSKRPSAELTSPLSTAGQLRRTLAPYLPFQLKGTEAIVLVGLTIFGVMAVGQRTETAQDLYRYVAATPTFQAARLKTRLKVVPGRTIEFSHLPGNTLVITQGAEEQLGVTDLFFIFAHQVSHQILGRSANETAVNRLAMKMLLEIKHPWVEPFAAPSLALNLERAKRHGHTLGTTLSGHFGHGHVLEELEDLAVESLTGTSSQTLVAAMRTGKKKPSSTRVLGVYDPNTTGWITEFEKTGLKIRKLNNRFEKGQCVWLAYAYCDTLPIDRRGGGRNNAMYLLDHAETAGWRTARLKPGQPLPRPEIGTIIVHTAWPGNPYGHVSIVTHVIDDRTFRVWDSNFSSNLDRKIRQREMTLDDYVIGYIYPPASYLPQPPDRWSLTQEPQVFGDNSFESKSLYFARRFELPREVPEQARIKVRLRLHCRRGQEVVVRVWPNQIKTIPVSTGSGWYEIGPFPIKNREMTLLVRPKLGADFLYGDYTLNKVEVRLHH